MKPGDRIQIIHMDDNNGKDCQATKMNGIVARVAFVDSAGQIHLDGYSLALIPGIDTYIILE